MSTLPRLQRRVLQGPDRYRTAVLLKDGLGLPAGQVAAAMGISVPAVRSVLHRARSALRESLSASES